jgi:hypothetical protein
LYLYPVSIITCCLTSHKPNLVCTLAITFGFFASNVRSNVNNLRRQTFSSITEHTGNSIRAVTTVAIGATEVVRSDYVDINDWSKAQVFIWSMYKHSQSQQIEMQASAYCGVTDGRVGGYSAMSDGGG